MLVMMSRGERERARNHVPILITVPYSELLLSAEMAGGQRTERRLKRIRARKRKKAKDKPEMRHVGVSLLDERY